jgi:hypothetical protein
MKVFGAPGWRTLCVAWMMAFAALTMVGCTALKLTYNNGNTLVYWWLNAYIDFDSDDKPFVNDEINDFFAWHRDSQLPEYARMLSPIADKLASPAGVTPADVNAWYASARLMAHQIAEQELPSFADLALKLRPEQIDNMAQKFSKNDQKFRKDQLSGGENDQRDFRYKKVLKNTEDWFGAMSPAQSAAIRRLSDARPLENQILLAERQAKQHALLDTLRRIQRERPSQEAVVGMLRPLLNNAIENTPTPQNAAFVKNSQDSTIAMTASIVGLATPAQRANAAEKVRRLAADFKTLSQQKK